jgi:hypothetical protein
MSNSNGYRDQELKLILTEEQRKELIRFIAQNGHVKLDIDVLFGGDVSANTIAPVAVLVGNAI